MLHANWKKAGLVAASLSLSLAVTPLTGAPAPAGHFINDQGELVSVDPPDPGRQPVFVAIPLSHAAATPARQSESGQQGK